MKEPVIVQTGEVKTGGRNDILKSSPIGSCVVVVLFDEEIAAGGMAHIMLPGKAPDRKDTVPARYAYNAIEELLKQMTELGARQSHLNAVIAGGGNVLKRDGDMIGALNADAVNHLLSEKNIPVLAQSVGGTNRKSVRFNIEQRVIYYTEGDSKEKILFEFSYKTH
ncbi:MAG: chemotaxis protein CheD [Prolixibacteraceae bacterium]